MNKVSKSIRLSNHAREQMVFRGCSEEEIYTTIKTSDWAPSALNRMECKKNFEFNKNWNNKIYRTKQVRPIFVEEETEIIVITVYVYYF